MKCDAELTKNRMHKCRKGTGFTWMLNKRAPSSCHTVTCALFVCGYCLSQFAHCWQPTRSTRPPWDMRQNKLTQITHTNAAFHRAVYQSPTHTHTYKPLLSQWLFDHSTFCQSVSNALDWRMIVMQPTRTEGTRLNENKKSWFMNSTFLVISDVWLVIDVGRKWLFLTIKVNYPNLKTFEMKL